MLDVSETLSLPWSRYHSTLRLPRNAQSLAWTWLGLHSMMPFCLKPALLAEELPQELQCRVNQRPYKIYVLQIADDEISNSYGFQVEDPT